MLFFFFAYFLCVFCFIIHRHYHVLVFIFFFFCFPFHTYCFNHTLMQFFFIILYYCFFIVSIKIFMFFLFFIIVYLASLAHFHQYRRQCFTFFFINSILYASSSSATSCWTTPFPSHQSVGTRAFARPFLPIFKPTSIQNNSGPIDSPQIDRGGARSLFIPSTFSETYFHALSCVFQGVCVCVRIIVYVCVCPLTNQTPVQNGKRRNPFPEEENEHLHRRLCRQAQQQLPH